MSKLNEPVTIHFTENSIPSLRRGKLTDESKQQIKDLMLELIDEVDWSIIKHQKAELRAKVAEL